MNKHADDREESSRKSVISNWDDYELKEEDEEEEEERAQFNVPLSPAMRGGGPLGLNEQRHPYLLTESPFSNGTLSGESPSPHRKVRKSVVQLQSEAELQRQQLEAEKLAAVQPTYAERLLNISADDKLRELDEGGVEQEEDDESQMQPCQNGSSATAEEKENLMQNGSADQMDEPNQEDDVERDENGEVKVVWKLPPEPEKKPNKKKKKKPKVSSSSST